MTSYHSMCCLQAGELPGRLLGAKDDEVWASLLPGVDFEGARLEDPAGPLEAAQVAAGQEQLQRGAAYLSLCLYTSISLSLCIYIYICVYVCLSVCLSMCIYVCIYIYIYIHMYIDPPPSDGLPGPSAAIPSARPREERASALLVTLVMMVIGFY